jgi:hypothetical protein
MYKLIHNPSKNQTFSLTQSSIRFKVGTLPIFYRCNNDKWLCLYGMGELGFVLKALFLVFRSPTLGLGFQMIFLDLVVDATHCNAK